MEGSLKIALGCMYGTIKKLTIKKQWIVAGTKGSEYAL
jgi:hypothetical protein